MERSGFSEFTFTPDDAPAFGASPHTPPPSIVLVDPQHLRRAAIARFLSDHLGVNVSEVGQLDADITIPARCVEMRALIIVNAGGARLRDDALLRGALQRFRQSAPEAALVMLSDHDDRTEVLAALELGVAGFIPNAMSPHTVIATLQMIQAGGEYAPRRAMMQDSAVSSAKMNARSRSARQLSPTAQSRSEEATDTETVHFTDRQREVLELMRRGQPNKEIAYLLNMKESTVKVHVRNIMRKFAVTNRTQVAYLATQFPPPLKAV